MNKKDKILYQSNIGLSMCILRCLLNKHIRFEMVVLDHNLDLVVLDVAVLDTVLDVLEVVGAAVLVWGVAEDDL